MPRSFGFKGKKHSIESRRRISLSLVGNPGNTKKPSVETRQRMSQAHMGNVPGNKGKKRSQDAIARSVAARLGKPLSAAHRAAIATSNRGRTHSPEVREKIGRASKGRTHSPVTRAKMSSSHAGQVPWNKGKRMGASFREAISKGQKGKAKTPLHRSRIGQSLRARWQRVHTGLRQAFHENGLPVASRGRLRTDRLEFLDVSSPERGPYEQAIHTESLAKIQRALRRLPNVEADCFARHFFAEEPIDFIARELHLSIPQVRRHLLRASARLKRDEQVQQLVRA